MIGMHCMAPFLLDDLLVEILLRLPPHPSCLLRVSLVCKRWRGLVTDPRFLRRLRAPPVVLGVYLNNPPAAVGYFMPAGDPPDRVPASRFHAPGRRWLVRDCRRGRALLYDGTRFLVWDPVSRESHVVPRPPVWDSLFNGFGAVLLRGDGGFRVAVAFVKEGGVAVAAVYSSDTGAWTNANTITLPQAPISSSNFWKEKPRAAVGDTMYWLLDDDWVLSLKLHAGGQHVLAVLKPKNVPAVYAHNVQLMRTPNGKLGLAAVMGSTLRLWSLETDGHGDAMAWTLHRTLLLDALLPGRPGQCHGESTTPCAWIVGVHEDGAAVFLRRAHAFFMLRLEQTPHIEKIGEMFIMKQRFDTVYPYANPFLQGNI